MLCKYSIFWSTFPWTAMLAHLFDFSGLIASTFLLSRGFEGMPLGCLVNQDCDCSQTGLGFGPRRFWRAGHGIHCATTFCRQDRWDLCDHIFNQHRRGWVFSRNEVLLPGTWHIWSVIFIEFAYYSYFNYYQIFAFAFSFSYF